MKPVILFDLDGTLIDSTEAILESFHHTFNLFKRDSPTDDAIKLLIGHTLDDMYKSLGVEEEHVWDFVDAYKAHYRTIATQKTQLLPIAVEAITLASTFARMGIVTTKTGVYSREILEFFNVMHFFEVLIGREDVTFPKPHKEPVEKALEAMSVTKNNVWLIGDTNIDVLSAKNANINHIAVTSGYESKKELQKHTNIIVDDALIAVREILKKFQSV